MTKSCDSNGSEVRPKHISFFLGGHAALAVRAVLGWLDLVGQSAALGLDWLEGWLALRVVLE